MRKHPIIASIAIVAPLMTIAGRHSLIESTTLKGTGDINYKATVSTNFTRLNSVMDVEY